MRDSGPVRGSVVDEVGSACAGVVVSNGRDVVRTDDSGAFALPAPCPEEYEDAATWAFRWVFVSVPAGYAPAGPWWYDYTREAPADCRFQLRRTPERAGSRLTFAVLNDCHLGRYPFSWLDDDLRSIADDSEHALDLIAAVGDMTQSGEPDELRSYLASCDRSAIPVLHVPGNHEWIADRAGGNWSDIVGPHYYSLDWGPVHLVVFESTAPHYTSGEPQDRWLLNDLAAVPDGKPVVLLLHHQREADFHDPLRRFNIVASVSGHWHSSRLYDDGHMVHLNCPSSTMGGIDYSARGYTVVQVDGDGEVTARRRLLGVRDRASRTGVGCVVEPPTTTKTDGDSPLEPTWRTRLPGGLLFGSPVIADGGVFIASLDEERPTGGHALKVAAETGYVLWQTPTYGGVKHSLVKDDDRVYGVNVTGKLFALDIGTGARRWEYQLGDPSARWMFSSPLVIDGTVVAGQSRHFAAVDAETGRERWVRDDLGGNDWISSYISPASDSSQVFIGFFWHRQALFALDLITGETRWIAEEPKAGPAATPELDGEGGVYLTCHDGTVRSFDTRDGSERWAFDLVQSDDERGGPRWSPGRPTFAEGTLYVPTGDGRVVALDAATGSLVWEWRSGPALAGVGAYERESRGVFSSPLVVDESVIVGANDGRLVGLSRETGALLWSEYLGVPVASSPVLSGSLLVCGASDGWLYAWRMR